jgi:hypothetical protein
VKINFDRGFVTLENTPLLTPGERQALTLRAVAAEALVRGFNGDNPSPTEALNSVKLARRIMSAEENALVEVTTEELAEIKRCICRGYARLISGQAMEMIEACTTDDIAPAPTQAPIPPPHLQPTKSPD